MSTQHDRHCELYELPRAGLLQTVMRRQNYMEAIFIYLMYDGTFDLVEGASHTRYNMYERLSYKINHLLRCGFRCVFNNNSMIQLCLENYLCRQVMLERPIDDDSLQRSDVSESEDESDDENEAPEDPGEDTPVVEAVPLASASYISPVTSFQQSRFDN